mgnify:CR=1 FL=1
MRNYHLAAIAVNLMALASYPSSTTRRVDDYPTPTGTHQDDDAIAKAQASYLGCNIDVRSAPGAGSTFTLSGLQTLP